DVLPGCAKSKIFWKTSFSNWDATLSVKLGDCFVGFGVPLASALRVDKPQVNFVGSVVHQEVLCVLRNYEVSLVVLSVEVHVTARVKRSPQTGGWTGRSGVNAGHALPMSWQGNGPYDVLRGVPLVVDQA